MCGYRWKSKVCRRRGAHYCEPRADKVVGFFAEVLVHTKGRHARQAFLLDWWQEWEIVRPLFGEVIFDPEWDCYVRRYTQALIVVARKNGKSELAAAIILYLLVADDEEAAEVYGAAKDTKQAGKVAEVVIRMRQLSAQLSARLQHNKNSRRVYDPKNASYYEVIPADAEGELGANPHGFVLDEVLSQPDGSLWEAMVTAEGTRLQALFLAITTETDDDASFGAQLIDECERIYADPARAPHIFAFCRKLPRTGDELDELRRRHRGHPDLPVSVNPFDERNWKWPNPALGSFLAVKALRKAAEDAQREPAKENGFRQFRCNQRVQQKTRWMPMHRWDSTAGMVDIDALEGRSCFAGLDLASTTDLAAWALRFPPDEEGGVYQVLYRFWTPEAQVEALDRYTGGQASVWVRQGFLAATEGDWIDYGGDPAVGGRSVHGLRGPHKLAIHPQIEADSKRFRILSAGYDQHQATATAQFMQGLELNVVPIYQGFAMSPALKDLMRSVMAGRERHGGHPVARWCADGVEVKTDDQERIKIVKPDRRKAHKRIDGIAAHANAIRAEQLYEPHEDSWFAMAVR